MRAILVFLGVPLFLLAMEPDPARQFYRDIVDICNPTENELEVLQERLLNTERPILKRLMNTAFIPREFAFYGQEQKRGLEMYGCDANHRENCIIMYASFNERYAQGVNRFVKALRETDYVGHLHYMIGGWPNIEGGDLNLAHVPFAFKIAFFRQMKAQGYRRVLWLDSSILPAKGRSMRGLMTMLRKKGIFIQANDHGIYEFLNPDTMRAFGLKLKEAKQIMSVSAAIIGLDFDHRDGNRLLDAWFEAAHDPYAFYSGRSDQNALSILVYQMKLTGKLLPRKLLGSLANQRGMLFVMDRGYVKDERE